MVPVFDRGFAYGDSLIETLKIRGGRPVFFHDHFLRLERSFEEAEFEIGLEEDGLFNQAVSLAETNQVTDGRLRIQITRGTPATPAGLDPVGEFSPTLLLTAEAFAGYPESLYEEGVVCRTVRANRGRFARFKSASLFSTIMARSEAAAIGAQEAIFTSSDGRLLETALANIIFLRDGRLATARETEPILAGITLAKLLDKLMLTSIMMSFEAPRLDELSPCEDAAFLTSSILGVCPVRSIDDVELRVDADFTAYLKSVLEKLELADITDTAES